MNVIEVVDLRKSYGDTQAVAGIDFEVRQGEIFGLLGPNGAGKTSTVEILEGFRVRDGGSVRALGLDPGDRRELQQLRARVGMVLQQGGHFRFLSVRETLQMHQRFHSTPRSVAEVLALVGLEDAAGRRFRELSGGQQRRLDVAVALIGRPELVFLDEPTTGFDPAARRQFWDTIDGLRELGTTIVLTTHYMEEAQRLADRVAVMQAGRIVGTGTPDQLAQRLSLGSRITFTLPDSLAVGDLPPVGVASAVAPQLAGGQVTLHVDDATAALATLCGWAVERGLRLDDLQLVRPSLEDTYLTLTGQGEI